MAVCVLQRLRIKKVASDAKEDANSSGSPSQPEARAGKQATQIVNLGSSWKALITVVEESPSLP